MLSEDEELGVDLVKWSQLEFQQGLRGTGWIGVGGAGMCWPGHAIKCSRRWPGGAGRVVASLGVARVLCARRTHASAEQRSGLQSWNRGWRLACGQQLLDSLDCGAAPRGGQAGGKDTKRTTHAIPLALLSVPFSWNNAMDVRWLLCTRIFHIVNFSKNYFGVLK